MWITGGKGYQTSEFVDKFGSIVGNPLPQDFINHCATEMNTTHGILTGGGYRTGGGYKNNTLIVRYEDFEMYEGPTLINGRTAHGCGQFRHPNGTNYVIVAGGSGQSGPTQLNGFTPGGPISSIEILNVDSSNEDGWSWFEGGLGHYYVILIINIHILGIFWKKLCVSYLH